MLEDATLLPASIPSAMANTEAAKTALEKMESFMIAWRCLESDNSQ